MTSRKKVLFIVPYPLGKAPSQRFRFEQYFAILRANGIDYQTQSFLTSSNWKVFYSKGFWFRKALALITGMLRRTVGILDAWSASFVFIHREAAPIGPPVFEWFIAKVLRKKIVYDFDDAIWLTDKKVESIPERILKWRGKISTVCKWSYRVSCGNEYLCDFARRFSSNVVLNPTTIDTLRLHTPGVQVKPSDQQKEIIIGWTGSHSTVKYLDMIEPVLQRLENTFHNIRFVVIADKPSNIALKRITFVRWNEYTEIDDLMKLDIGVMPLPGDEWSRGKCGFKILQYMALCIPSVSSPVGVNSDIVEHGKNGFLCSSEQEWIACLSSLIADANLRQEFGNAGRKTVTDGYSVSSNTSTFLSLFK